MINGKYIILWCKPSQIEWDFYIHDQYDILSNIIKNLKDQGVHQYHTYYLGSKLIDFSSEY